MSTRRAPTTETDRIAERLATILAEVMEIDHVPLDSDYFDDLGADSMTVAQLCARLRDEPDLPSPSIKDVYHHRNVVDLAASFGDVGEGEGEGEGDEPVSELELALRETAPAEPVPRWQWLSCGAIQLLTVIGAALAAATVLTVGFEWASAADGPTATFARSAEIAVATFVVWSIVPIVAKWLLLGRTRPEQFEVWGPRYIRFWLVKVLVRSNPLVLFVGTPLFNWYLRALGARIGRRVLVLARQVPVSADLLTIGDDAVVRKDSLWACYRAHSGWIQTGPVTIGCDALVGEGTVLDIHTTVGDGAQVGHSSTLYAGQTVPPGEHRYGTPARAISAADLRDVAPCGSGTIRRIAYPMLRLVFMFGITAPATFAVFAAIVESRLVENDLWNTSASPFASWRFWEAVLVVSVVLFLGSILVGLVFVFTVPRMVARAIEPGRTYPLYGIRYWSHRAVSRFTNVPFFTRIFGDSSYIVHYLYLLGYGVTFDGQTGANFGTTIKHDHPYLVTVGRGTMAADVISIVNAEYSSTSFRLDPVAIGSNSFLGNLVVFSSRATTGEDVLLASKLHVPIEGDTHEHAGFLGSPEFEIPRTVARDHEFDDIRYGDDFAHHLAAKNRHNLVTIAWFLFTRWIGTFVAVAFALGAIDLYEQHEVLAVLGGLLIATVYRPFFDVLVERASIAFGRIEPTFCSLWEPANWRVERYWKTLWMPRILNGTPFRSVIWRLVGVRVGRRLFDDGCAMIERHLITVGDHCTINATAVIQPHSQEDGTLKSDHIEIGSGCTVGIASLVHYGTSMGDGASLEPNSFLTKGARVPPSTAWGDNPARELDRPLDRPRSGAVEPVRRAGTTWHGERRRTTEEVSMTNGADTAEYWRDVLSHGGFTALPRWSTEPRHGTAELALDVGDDMRSELHRLADVLDVEPSALALAAHAAVLFALSGERAIITGYASVHGAVPCRLSAEPASWRELIESVARTESATRQHADGPIERIRDELGQTGPAFETVIDTIGGPDVATLDDETVLHARIALTDDRPAIELRYRTDAFDADCAARMAGYHHAALLGMVADPDAEHRRTSLVSDDERRHQIEGLAGPCRELPDQRMHELFEERVRRHPDAIAAVHAERRITYAELNSRANRLARVLVERGVRAETVVAVVTERNLDWMTTVLAIFKAGGVYLPIEPQFPADRIAKTLARAGCGLVVTEDGSTTSLDEALDTLADVEVVDVDAIDDEDHADDDLGVDVTPDQLAYIYFTSGSTGEPKGAMCEHAGMVNHLVAKIDDFGIREGETVAQIAPQCFDISLWQLVTALLVGGRTLLVEQETLLDPRRFIDTIVDGEVGVMQVVPSYLEVLLSSLEQHPRDLPDLHCVSVTGEALTLDLVKRWFATDRGIKLANAYGLTETSDDTNHEVMDAPPERGGVMLGPAVNNVHVYVVDEHLSPVPLGAPGEIVFSGVCVGRGYINDPERTRQAYTDDPLRPGERLYRSGDFGRWRPDGKLEYLGRRDAQVKIRGFRIEIGEIENALVHQPEIRRAAVVITDPGERSAQLVAFYSGEPVDADDLAERIGASLPSYMVPAAFHRREELPLTDNGKIDRKALTAEAHDIGSVDRANGEAPVTPTERRLAGVWAAVLEAPVAEIGRRDHFFERGGTSLTAVELVLALDDEVTLQDIALHPVLADLARSIDGAVDHVASGLLQPLSEPTGLLVCFPYAGGNAIAFRELAGELVDTGLAVHAVELPGHDLTSEPAPFESLDDVVERTVDEIVRMAPHRIVLWGHSAGAAFAVATALGLERAGRDVEHVFVGAHLLGDVDTRRDAIEALALSSDVDVSALLDAEGGFSALRELDAGRAQRVNAAFRHDCVSAHRCVLGILDDPARARLSSPVTLVVAADDPATNDRAHRDGDWGTLADRVDVHELPDGGHYFVRTRPADVADVVRRTIGGSGDITLRERSTPPTSSYRTTPVMPATNGDRPTITDDSIPVIVADADGDLVAWAAERGDGIRAVVAEHGAVVIRGAGVRSADDLVQLTGGIASELMPEREAFAGRTEHAPGVYSSTTWPANQAMCMHHEMSYRFDVPAMMLFACIRPADDGGAIGIADGERILADLPTELTQRFTETGWTLARAYTGDIGLPIEEAFGTGARHSIERYCRANGIEFEWDDADGLRTRQHRSAVIVHPGTGRPCWFNQIAFLNEWTMKPVVRDFLLDTYGPDGLPFNTLFGDGDPIDRDVVATINEVYDANTTHVELRAGDLLVVDNLRCAHGREAYDGAREMVVALADPVRVPDLRTAELAGR